MSEQSDKNDLDISTESPVLNTESNQASSKKTGALWFFTIVNLLFMCAMVAAAYWVYLQWQNMQSQKTDNTETYITQIQQLQSQVDSVRLAGANREQSIQSNLNNLVEELLENQQDIDLLESKLTDISGQII
jgi:negative regulator of sigma E activity